MTELNLIGLFVQNHSLYFTNSPVIYLSHALSYCSGVCSVIIFFRDLYLVNLNPYFSLLYYFHRL